MYTGSRECLFWLGSHWDLMFSVGSSGVSVWFRACTGVLVGLLSGSKMEGVLHISLLLLGLCTRTGGGCDLAVNGKSRLRSGPLDACRYPHASS
jgi:hypothetical protein